jgi:hypothetical protein
MSAAGRNLGLVVATVFLLLAILGLLAFAVSVMF